MLSAHYFGSKEQKTKNQLKKNHGDQKVPKM